MYNNFYDACRRDIYCNFALQWHYVIETKENNEERERRIFNDELFPHMEPLKTFAFHLTYNDQDAEDLVQETYLKAHKFIDRYVEGTNAKAWLFKILKNAYINEYRKKSKRPAKVDYEDIVSYQDSEDPKSPGFPDLRDDLFKDRMGDEVTVALNALPVDFRTVILLCDIEEFTYEEISKIIDVPIGTVRSRLFRARNMLKDKLKTYAQKMGYKDYRGKDRDEEE
ncbi:MAG: sigma-70 family RNA polymerase sigma factor [Saprospiraceae bacterium]|nr:sigma-70 family RNA polymerase sigma factor [Saprospiraceae bacterium]